MNFLITKKKKNEQKQKVKINKNIYYFNRKQQKEKEKERVKMATDEQQFNQLLECLMSLDNNVRQQAEVCCTAFNKLK